MDFLFNAFPQGEKERESHLSEISVILSQILLSSERPRCDRDEWHVTAISHFNGALGWQPGTHQSLASNSGSGFLILQMLPWETLCASFFSFLFSLQLGSPEVESGEEQPAVLQGVGGLPVPLCVHTATLGNHCESHATHSLGKYLRPPPPPDQFP